MVKHGIWNKFLSDVKADYADLLTIPQGEDRDVADQKSKKKKKKEKEKNKATLI